MKVFWAGNVGWELGAAARKVDCRLGGRLRIERLSSAVHWISAGSEEVMICHQARRMKTGFEMMRVDFAVALRLLTKSRSRADPLEVNMQFQGGDGRHASHCRRDLLVAHQHYRPGHSQVTPPENIPHNRTSVPRPNGPLQQLHHS